MADRTGALNKLFQWSNNGAKSPWAFPCKPELDLKMGVVVEDDTNVRLQVYPRHKMSILTSERQYWLVWVMGGEEDGEADLIFIPSDDWDQSLTTLMQ